MTEQEWLTATDPWLMHWVLDAELTSKRKPRLFVCAYCRFLWDFLTDEPALNALRVAELFADGETTEEEREGAILDLNDVDFSHPTNSVRDSLLTEAGIALTQTFHPPAKAWHEEFGIRMPHARLMREIFGNPFRTISFNAAWRTSTVTRVAQTIYDDRHLPSGLFDNQRMGILADALEEAGCDNTDILEHCRQGGEHVRGCWVVDLVLGKQ